MSRIYNERFDNEAFKIEFSILLPDAAGDIFEPREINFVCGPYASMTDVNACIKRVQSGKDNQSWMLRWHKPNATVTWQVYRTTTQWEPVSA